MSDPSVQLDPVIQKGLIDFIEKRVGLFGALRLKHVMEGCTCGPCKTFEAIFSGADLPEPPTEVTE